VGRIAVGTGPQGLWLPFPAMCVAQKIPQSGSWCLANHVDDLYPQT